MSMLHKPRVGLALGSGSARGWAHIGVIRALEEMGIRPDIVCGTSIGSLVGAAYAAGELDHFEQWALGLELKDVVTVLDMGTSGGLLKGDRLMDFFRQRVADRSIEELSMPFAAVATALHNGAEIWLRSGSALRAVRASIALPGLLSPVLHDGMVLVDGGLVNPVPVSLARALGADVVIAVDLNSDILGRHLHAHPAGRVRPGILGEWVRKLRTNLDMANPSHSPDEPTMPSIAEVVASSINIMQVRIARSRMAGEPPDLIVAPRLAHFRLLDFHRAQEAIEEGRRAVKQVAEMIASLQHAGVASESVASTHVEV